jgi:soluble lytic murein transglycosylase-like protein
MGSAEGYYRLALVHLDYRALATDGRAATCLLAMASQLGHRRAAEVLEQRAAGRAGQAGNSCEATDFSLSGYVRFDIDAYTRALPAARHEVVALIRRLAPRYGIDVRLALAVASAESNFNSKAISPKNAMGVMQLIPETALRFGVDNPFDPEQNIRGGLAYLRWLQRHFDGDSVRMIAAYNAGERAVEGHGGVPPYAETVAYVSRVLYFSGGAFDAFPGAGAGGMAATGRKPLKRRPEL